MTTDHPKVRHQPVPASRLAAWLGGRWGVGVAALAGALLPLAFAPFEWAWLSVAAPAVLFAVVSSAPERRARLAGYAFGLGYFGVGVSWVYVSMAQFGAGGWFVSGILTVLFVAGLALFPLVLVMLAQRFAPIFGPWRMVFALPLLWVLLEWVRSWLLTGFPWLLLGYSQVETPLASVAPVFGVLAISWLLALCAGALAWLVLAPSGRRGIVVAVVGAATLAAGPLLDRDWTEALDTPLRVALVQGNMPQDIKWDPAYLRATQTRYREMTEAHWDADLIVWPESAIPLLHHQIAEDYLAPIAAEAERHDTEVLLGVPVFDAANRRFHNSLVAITGERGHYHKQHLVPFGEYLPLRGVFGRALDILGAPMADFSPGEAPARPLRVAGHDIAASICYEVVFGREIARLAPAAELLVNVSNDAWFGASLAPYQHLQKARMRALETGRPMLRGTNTGITAIIDHRGRVAHSIPQFEADTLRAEVTPRRGATPYARWTDQPVLGAMFVGIVLLGAVGWRAHAPLRQPVAGE